MNKDIPDIKLITSNLVFIGGVTRSGKGFLCPIASSFEKFEMFFMSSIAENISYISKLKKLMIVGIDTKVELTNQGIVKRKPAGDAPHCRKTNSLSHSHLHL